MAICTECGQPIETRQKYIAGVMIFGSLEFTWSCEHHPLEDADVKLGSEDCVESFIAKHPEYADAIAELFHVLAAQRRHGYN